MMGGMGRKKVKSVDTDSGLVVWERVAQPYFSNGAILLSEISLINSPPRNKLSLPVSNLEARLSAYSSLLQQSPSSLVGS